MQEQINFTLNGQPECCLKGISLEQYLNNSSINPAGVVAEANGEILKPDAFGAYIINAEDQIEIIHFVGGG